MGKNCARGLEYGPRPSALGRTQDQGHSFSPTDRPSPVNNIFIFSCSTEIGFAAAYKWVCSRNFVLESGGAPSTDDL